MVKIGYLNSYKLNDIVYFLNRQNVSFVKECELDGNIQFIEIETENLNFKGICCLGKTIYTYQDINLIEKYYKSLDLKRHPISMKAMKEIHKREKRLFTYDAKRWIKFLKKFVSKYDMIILYRYYPDMHEIDNGVKFSISKKLRRSHLLNLSPNQKLIIGK